MRTFFQELYLYTVYIHQAVPLFNSAVKTQPQVRPVEQIKRMKKNSVLPSHNPCETELLDIGKTSIIKEEIIKSKISKLRSMLEKKATIVDNLVNLEAAKKQKQ